VQEQEQEGARVKSRLDSRKMQSKKTIRRAKVQRWKVRCKKKINGELRTQSIAEGRMRATYNSGGKSCSGKQRQHVKGA